MFFLSEDSVANTRIETFKCRIGEDCSPALVFVCWQLFISLMYLFNWDGREREGEKSEWKWLHVIDAHHRGAEEIPLEIRSRRVIYVARIHTAVPEHQNVRENYTEVIFHMRQHLQSTRFGQRVLNSSKIFWGSDWGYSFALFHVPLSLALSCVSGALQSVWGRELNCSRDSYFKPTLKFFKVVIVGNITFKLHAASMQVWSLDLASSPVHLRALFQVHTHTHSTHQSSCFLKG